MIIRKLIAIIISILFIVAAFFYKSLYDNFWILSSFVFFVIIIGLLAVIFFSIKKDKVSVYISLFAFILGTSILLIDGSGLFKSKVEMKAVLNDDMTSIELFLRENNTYECNVDSWMGRCETYYGEYKKEGELIAFVEQPGNNCFDNDTLFIVDDKLILEFLPNGEPDTSFANYFRIDKNEME